MELKKEMEKFQDTEETRVIVDTTEPAEIAETATELSPTTEKPSAASRAKEVLVEKTTQHGEKASESKICVKLSPTTEKPAAASPAKEVLVERTTQHGEEASESEVFVKLSPITEKPAAASPAKEVLVERTIQHGEEANDVVETLKNQVKVLEEEKFDMELKEQHWKMARESLSNDYIQRLSALKEQLENERSTWEVQRRELEEARDNFRDKFNAELQKVCTPDSGSALERLPEKLPIWMRPMVAPKGHVSGDELGILMGSLVSITAYIVTYANEDVKILAPSAFATLCGIVIGTMINNIVSRISEDEDEDANIKPILSKGVPWVIMGGIVPIFVGGFIQPWRIRCGVTSAVTVALTVCFAIAWSKSYKIPKKKALIVVGLGVFGTGLAAGLPHLIGFMGKLMGNRK